LDAEVAVGDVETVGVSMMDDSATVGALMLDAVVAVSDVETVGVSVVTFRSIGSDQWAAHKCDRNSHESHALVICRWACWS
jgi:hypothetical protein